MHSYAFRYHGMVTRPRHGAIIDAESEARHRDRGDADDPHGHLRQPPRNRAWRKLHLAVDAKSDQIVASDLTNHRIWDSTPVPALLEQTDHPLASLCADGTYDKKSVYEAARRKGNGQPVRVLIPPRRNARLKSARQEP